MKIRWCADTLTGLQSCISPGAARSCPALHKQSWVFAAPDGQMGRLTGPKYSLSASSQGCSPTSELRQQKFPSELSGGRARRQREQRGFGVKQPPFVSVTHKALLFEKPNLSRICAID